MILLKSMESHFFNTQIQKLLKTCNFKEKIMYTYDEDISVKRAKQNWLWRLQHAREARLNAILAFFAGFVFGLAAAYTLVWVTTL